MFDVLGPKLPSAQRSLLSAVKTTGTRTTVHTCLGGHLEPAVFHAACCHVLSQAGTLFSAAQQAQRVQGIVHEAQARGAAQRGVKRALLKHGHLGESTGCRVKFKGIERVKFKRLGGWGALGNRTALAAPRSQRPAEPSPR